MDVVPWCYIFIDNNYLEDGDDDHDAKYHAYHDYDESDEDKIPDHRSG